MADHYTPEQDEAILNSNKSNREIAEELGRTVKSIEQRKARLKRNGSKHVIRKAGPKAERKPRETKQKTVDLADAFRAANEVRSAVGELPAETRIEVLEFVLEMYRAEE